MSKATKANTKLTSQLLSGWANDPKGPVALTLKQRLLAVDAEPGQPSIIFPPTYAIEEGYVIDTLGDGKKLALVDSVGSQANRLEPIFKAEDPEDALVPQIVIELKESGKDSEPSEISILDLAHRAADAVVQSSPGLRPDIEEAFLTLHKIGNSVPLAVLAPTSLIFGVWDSRGESGEKRPRLIRSEIRAWDVEKLKTSSQFNSVWKKLSDKAKDELSKEAKKRKKKLSVVGLNDAPSEGLGGILVHDRIERTVTVNLVALRGLRGENETESSRLREYLLGLALTAATAEIDLYLREGCHLRYADEDRWLAIPRRGNEAEEVDLTSDAAQKTLQSFTREALAHFRTKWPKELTYKFDLKAAKNLLSKKIDEEQ